jgi:hypothetical protein
MPYRFILLLTSLCLFPILMVGQEGSDWWSEKPAGFYNNTTFGIVTMRGNLFTGMQSSAGYKLNPHIAFGGGIGIERYTDTPTYDTLTANLSLLPVFAEIRYTVLNKRVSPVIAVSGGYKVLLNVPSSQMISWTEEVYPGYFWTDFYEYDTYTQGGLFFTIEAGVKANVWKRLSMYLSADYSLWSVAGDHHYWMYEHAAGNTTETHEVSRTVAYTHMFVVRLGFGF